MSRLRFTLFLSIISMLAITGSLVSEPVQIHQLDLSNYPRVALEVHAHALHPSFISAKTDLQFQGQEILGNQQYSLEELVVEQSPAQAEVLNLVIVLDATRSVSKHSFEKSRQQAIYLLKQLRDQDRSAIYLLKAEPILLADVSRDHAYQMERLRAVKRDGKRTRLYDALYSGIFTARSMSGNAGKELRAQTAGARATPDGGERTVVALFSDGREEDSYLTDNDCYELTELGRRLAIPVYVYLMPNGTYRSGSSKRYTKKSRKYKKSTGSSRRNTSSAGKTRPQFARLKRLAMKTGGQIWVQPAPHQMAASKDQLRLLGYRKYLMHYTSPSLEQGAWPGDVVTLRIGMHNGRADFSTVHSYRVPLSAFIRARYGSAAWIIGLVLLIVLLFAMALIFLLWLLSRLSKDDKKDATQSHRLAGQAGRAQSVLDGRQPGPEESDLPDLTPYLVGPEDQPGADVAGVVQPANSTATVRAAAHPAGMLMEDERRLYMREYNYRLLQMALREAGRYSQASLESLNQSATGGTRNYDLFLESTVLGSGRWANIPIHDNTISPIHARIKKVDDRYVIYDMLSAGGVYVNGRKILRPRGLCDGDEIRIGRSRFRFEAQN